MYLSAHTRPHKARSYVISVVRCYPIRYKTSHQSRPYWRVQYINQGKITADQPIKTDLLGLVRSIQHAYTVHRSTLPASNRPA